MQTEVNDGNQRPHWVIPVTEWHYMVVRAVNIRQETAPGVYGSHKSWRTSFFYISSIGANYWISLPRFAQGVKKYRESCKRRRKPSTPFISKPRPEIAVWVEPEDRRGGLFFRPYLTYSGSPGTRTVGTNTTITTTTSAGSVWTKQNNTLFV